MSSFIFDLQRFDQVEISAGDTREFDGVTYEAVEDTQLNLDDGKISGIASGKVEAVITGTTNPTITFDASDGAFDFTAATDSTLNVGYNNVNIHYAGGALTYTANNIQIPAGEISVVGTGDIPINATINFPTANNCDFCGRRYQC